MKRFKSLLSRRELGAEARREPEAFRNSVNDLEAELLISKELCVLCREFCESIRHVMQLLIQLWRLMQQLGPDWIGDDTVLTTHVWALRTGVNATAMPVFTQLQGLLKVVEKLQSTFQDLEAKHRARDAAWIEKEHYEQKVREMRSELTRKGAANNQAAPAPLSPEQLVRLGRNEEKCAAAMDRWESLRVEAWSGTASGRHELKSALSDVVRTVTCGWFISTGAGVCSALSQAEARASEKAAAAQNSSSSKAAAVPAITQKSADDEDDELVLFDPSDPFRQEWHCSSIVIEEVEDEHTEDTEEQAHVQDEQPWDAVERLRQEVGEGLRICILGGTVFHSPESEALVKAVAQKLAADLGNRVVFITNSMAGVQKAFAENCGDGSRLWNLFPSAKPDSKYGVGNNCSAGSDPEQTRAIFGQLGQVYITAEGGPALSQEAWTVHVRGARVLPLLRTGGASSGKFDFPPPALARPNFVNEKHWSLLANSSVPVSESAAAVVAIIRAFLLAHDAAKLKAKKVVREAETAARCGSSDQMPAGKKEGAERSSSFTSEEDAALDVPASWRSPTQQVAEARPKPGPTEDVAAAGRPATAWPDGNFY